MNTESTLFKNELGFIAHLLKRDHGIEASEDLVWRIICKVSNWNRDQAENQIIEIANDPVELAKLAEAIRNDFNKMFQHHETIQHSVQYLEPKVAPYEQLVAVGLVSFVAGCLVSFLITHWS